VSELASLAARVLRRTRGVAVDPAPSRDPAPLVAVARRALAQRRRRLISGKVTVGGTALAAAAAVAFAFGPWRRADDAAARLAARAAARSLSLLEAPAEAGPGGGHSLPGSALATGVSLQAPPEAPVRIGSADGTVLTLEAHGELSIVEQSSTRKFSLRRGAVRAQVARLQPGERFLISTGDAEIEVHGTVFRVALSDGDSDCEEGRRTRVSVAEGVVSVRAGGRETLVAAGDSWPACAVTPPVTTDHAPAAAAAPADDPTSPEHRLATGRRRARGAHPLAGAAGLAVANDLFAAAVHAKRERRPDEALRLFSRLLDVAPDGPLAEGARAQRMKLLEASDPASARRAAAEYLTRYPDGFARDDARRLVGNDP
jgi:ferric-dicitrate binding protein FerR (iron transport regulator)